MESIVKSAEETISKIHIADRIDALREVNRAWHLTVVMGPVVLDTFHVPLVNNDNNFLVFRLIDSLEEVIISIVDEDFLELGEENVHALDVPIEEVLINAFLRELSRLRGMGSLDDFFSLLAPE